MKMYRITIALAFCFAVVSANAFTVEECQRLARENYPLIKRYGLIEKSEGYSLSNASRGYLPQVSIMAQATYQSDVTEVPINDIPNIPIHIDPLSKDQYKAVVDVSQTIWDGGVINKQRKITHAASEVEQKQVDADLYALNQRINNLFFGILLFNEQLNQNALMQAELQRSYEEVSTYIANGIANQADLDAVKVNQLNTKQQQTELETTREAYCDMLAYFTTVAVEPELLRRPADELLVDMRINRPELALLDARVQQLELQKGLLTARNLPKLGAFVQGGYGNPGLNMLKNEFDLYYVVGARFTWNFGGLYTQKNEKRILKINQSTLETQRETFLFNTGMELTQQNSKVEKLRKLMTDDDEIIRLRHNIRKTSELKVANGTLTVTDMLRDLTAEDQARQNKALHEIQLLMSIYEIKNTTNN